MRRDWLQTALSAVLPPLCLTCEAQVETPFGLCGPCWRELRFVSGLTCRLCAVPLPGEAPEAEALCDDCLVIARPWQAGASALVYSGTGRSLVLALKHADRQDIARAAAPWLARAAGPLVTPDTVLVPVPLHPWRLLHRGSNQSVLLAAALARHLTLPHCPDALIRTRATLALDGQGREARFATLQGAIRPHPRRRALTGRDVILVDDVMTSGATLAAASEAAHAAGAKRISVLTLARVAKAP
ncbi:double zinc ribbon domain-containing protein [Litorisediminicola beolgyonensis]|uniref:Double zinc ribbon domain-containing protein n=1 Tax=Litorisediminicola beolgyonensis TaxID=1173614 RepID=A0ABW3ZM04_9RHOB